LQDLESSDHYWTGVRGHGYFDGAYRSLDAWGRRHPGELIRIVGELKEEYDNEYDSTAVAVYLDGLKSGYVSASSSCTVFGYVAHLRSRGIRCLVPVEYEHDGADTDAEYSRSVYIALATVRRIPELVDAPLVEGELESFWDHLSAEDRDSFRKAGWHLDERTLTILNAHRPGLPHVLIPRICDGSEPHPVRIFLMRRRRECAEEREEETVRRNSEIVRLCENFGSIAEVARTLGLSTSTISRVLREAGVPRSTPKLKVTDDEIIHAYGRFSNMSRVGRELGISSTTVSHVLDRHGVERSGRGIASTGMNGHNASAMLERNERCSQVLEMRESGASLDEISRALGISKGTAKILVRDGKFYRQPSSYPARISLAREMQNDPEGCASGMWNARVRKVKRDLAFLLQEHPDLILRY